MIMPGHTHVHTYKCIFVQHIYTCTSNKHTIACSHCMRISCQTKYIFSWTSSWTVTARCLSAMDSFAKLLEVATLDESALPPPLQDNNKNSAVPFKVKKHHQENYARLYKEKLCYNHVLSFTFRMVHI